MISTPFSEPRCLNQSPDNTNVSVFFLPHLFVVNKHFELQISVVTYFPNKNCKTDQSKYQLKKDNAHNRFIQKNET